MAIRQVERACEAEVRKVSRQVAYDTGRQIDLHGVAKRLGEKQHALVVQGKVGSFTEPGQLPDVRRQVLVGRATELLSQATPDAPHPVTLVELAEEKKVLVAELAGVTSRMPEDQTYYTRVGVAHQMAFQQAQDLAAEWFTADAVKARLKYRSLDDDSRDRKDTTRTASAS